LQSALTKEIPAMTRIKAIIYFNQNYDRDWRIDSSPTATRAYAEGLAMPIYRAASNEQPYDQA
jgi:hypothetical protein